MTDFTLKKLREIVWVELPSIGDNITQNISGTIEEVNEKLKSKPGLLNEDPYGEGWILVLTPTNIDAELK